MSSVLGYISSASRCDNVSNELVLVVGLPFLDYHSFTTIAKIITNSQLMHAFIIIVYVYNRFRSRYQGIGPETETN